MITDGGSSSTYQVIDADGHVIEPRDLWTGEYMPSAHRERGPILSADGRLRYQDGKDYPFKAVWTDWDAAPLAHDARSAPPLSLRGGAGREGGFDPSSRIKDLDLDGIDAVVLYPTLGLAASWVEQDAGLASAMARAYNLWLADFCKPYPNRLFGIAMLPVVTIEAAIEEMKFARRELGMKGGFLRPNPFMGAASKSVDCDVSSGRLRTSDDAYLGRQIHSPEYDRIWAEAQELDFSISLHPGGSYPHPQAGQDRFPNWSTAQHIVMHPMEMMLACTGLIMSGVFERFPRLRVAFLESGGGWVMPLLDRMDWHFKRLHDRLEYKLSVPPSQYFRRNCWISFEPVEDSLSVLPDLLGPEKCLWATDYPHGSGFFPGAPRLIADRSDLASETKKQILGQSVKALHRIQL